MNPNLGAYKLWSKNSFQTLIKKPFSNFDQKTVLKNDSTGLVYIFREELNQMKRHILSLFATQDNLRHFLFNQFCTYFLPLFIFWFHWKKQSWIILQKILWHTEHVTCCIFDLIHYKSISSGNNGFIVRLV